MDDRDAYMFALALATLAKAGAALKEAHAMRATSNLPAGGR